jgi:hypothetical protein
MDACCVRRVLPAGRKRDGVRRNRVVLAPRPWRYVGRRFPADNGGKKGRSPGRARISRNTIARGKPGCLGCTCLTRVHSFVTLAHGAAGASSARLSLCPLISEGQRDCTTRAKSSRGNASACLNVIVSASASSDGLAPLAGRGRRAPARRVRVTLRESVSRRDCGDSPSPQPSKSELRSSRPREERGEGARQRFAPRNDGFPAPRKNDRDHF